MRSREELKRDARAVLEAGLAAVDPAEAVRRHLNLQGRVLTVDGPGGTAQTFALGRDVTRVIVVGAGKAGGRMCQAVEAVLGDRIEGGLVVTKTGHAVRTERVEVVESSHPVPDERGLRAARRIADAVRHADAATLVIVLISGGGSALLPLPADGISLDEKRAVTELLLAAGADIGEANAVRKHLSGLKGGWLARLAAPAAAVALVMSDVIGDRLDVIASGPTAPDPSTFADAEAVLHRRCGGQPGRVPASVWARLERGRRGEIPETPKPGDACFDRVLNVVVGSNAAALDACVREARARGLRPLLLTSTVEGEACEIAKVYAALARECRRSGSPAAPPACLVAGGEPTVTIRGAGRGGRSQALALAAAPALRDLGGGVVLLAAGTDGTDGPTDAAGAFAFADTVDRARALGLDPADHLDRDDAYPFFDALGDLLRTGPTGTNVMDIHLVIVDEA